MSGSDPVLENGTLTRFSYHGRDGQHRGTKSTFMKVPPFHRKFPDEEEKYPENVNHVDFTVKNV